MCYNCGCANAHDDMGNPDNIIESTLQKIATLKGEELKLFKKNLLSQLEQNKVDPQMDAEFVKAAKAWGQSLEEARKNTIDLLKTQIK